LLARWERRWAKMAAVSDLGRGAVDMEGGRAGVRGRSEVKRWSRVQVGRERGGEDVGRDEIDTLPLLDDQ
jgi:hypothetical protein